MILDYLAADRILLDSRARKKEEMLAELAQILAGQDAALGKQVIEALLERESVMSTGIGHGIAVPHARLDSLKEIRLALARHPQGLDFRALDGQPVFLAFAVIGPPSQADAHVKLLACIARLVKQGGAIGELMAASDAGTVLEILRRHAR